MSMVWRSLVAGIFLSTGVVAEPLAELQGLAAVGDYDTLLVRISALPEAQRQGLPLRLLHAEALQGSGRLEEAVATLRETQTTYPNSPEIYNNLAALYLAEGESEQARKTLEQALQIDPRYATIYRNLLAVNEQIARQSYVRALVVKESAVPLLERLFPPESQPLDLADVDALVAVIPGSGVPEDAPIIERSETADAPEVIAGAEAVTEAVAVLESVAPVVGGSNEIVGERGVLVDGRPISPDRIASTADGASSTERPIRAVLANWAEGWSGKQIDRYLDTYAADFRPRSGLSYSLWRSERQRRIERPRWIKVELKEIVITLRTDGSVDANFIQRYSTDNYGDLSRKRLRLQVIEGQWRIVDEVTLEMLS